MTSVYLGFLFFVSQCAVSLEMRSRRDVFTVQQTFTTHTGERPLVRCVKARFNHNIFFNLSVIVHSLKKRSIAIMKLVLCVQKKYSTVN